MPEHRVPRVRNQRGAVLVTALLVMTVLVIQALAFLATARTAASSRCGAGGRRPKRLHRLREHGKMHKRLLGDKGFTAAEVVIAATVLAIVLMAVAGMFASGTRDIQSGGTRSRAAFLAHQKLEELRNLPAFPPAPVAPAPPATDNPAPGFTRTWAVPAVTGSAPSRLATVAVTVSWTDSTGQKSVQSVTYLTEP